MKAKIIKDLENDFYVAFLEAKGGPIISAASIEDVKEKFTEAYKLYVAVSCLLRFSTHEDFNFDTKELLPENIEFEEPMHFM